MENQKSALGLDGNITALIGYLIPLIALILVFMEKDNKFVRFHALQSILWNVIVTVAVIALVILGLIISGVISYAVASLGWIVWMLFILAITGLSLAAFGGTIFAAIKAFGGNMFKLPFVGNMADKWV
ncbi:MAG: DUF4870 domain-containing protein [Acidobacteriota bacterium]|jgi:uncharacterized membrane protein|nr:DUF4870 domain-containing protein [Acidobacteriota bacterium]